MEIFTIEDLFHEESSTIGSTNNTSNSIRIETDEETVTHSVNKSKESSTVKQELPPCMSNSVKATLISAVFTSLVMTIAILIVCFTSPKPPGKICTYILKSEARNLISDDSHPHSIVVADLNSDGLPDVVVANSATNNIGIFIRRDNTTFTDPIMFSTGSGSTPYSVAVADFNNDQQMDIVVANFHTNNIGIFLGLGNGNFTAQITFSTESSRPRWVAAGHFNNDTFFDIAVINDGTNSIGILLGDGTGQFETRNNFFTGYDSLPYALVIADFNNDNKSDIAVANFGTNNVGIFLGYGNGIFAEQIIFTTGTNSQPYSLASSDLNGDTHIDIVIVYSGTNNVAVVLGYGNGSFALPTKYSTGNNSLPLSVVIGDINNDTKLDIIVANNGNSSVSVFLGYGNGTFSDQKIFFMSYNSKPYSISTGDFNNDKQMDIVAINYDNSYIDVILTYWNFTLSSQIIYQTLSANSNPESIVFSDFNNDGRVDMAVTNYGANNVGILLGYGDGSFSRQTIYSTGSGSGPSGIATGDFNSDHRQDIVVVNYFTNNIGIFFGYGDGSFANQVIYSTGIYSNPFSVATSDLNNDNQLDIAVVNYWTNNIGIFMGCGNGTFLSVATYFTGSYSGPRFLAIGDLNNDKQQDIVVVNYLSSTVGIYLGPGDGTFLNYIVYSTGSYSYPESVSLGDFNNDHQLDIIVANYWANNIVLFLACGNGTCFSQFTYSVGNGFGPSAIANGDFNNDGQLDIVVANYFANSFSIFIGFGNGSFAGQINYLTGSNSYPWYIAVGDLNNDNQSDLAVANYGSNSIALFLKYDNGSFKIQNTYSTRDSSRPQSVVVGDFNDDGQMDIAVTNYQGNTINIFLGFANGMFSSPWIYSTGTFSSPLSIKTGDFNNDNQLDIVVTNSWTGNIGIFFGYGNGTFKPQITYSTGSNSQPYDVAIGDFNNDNRSDIAVANYQNNNVGIFLNYGDGSFSNQITYSTGSNSGPRFIGVADFNNDSQPDIMVVNQWNNNIGIFIGYHNATFSYQTTYSAEKGSAPYYAAVGDLNGDNRLDIVVLLYDNRAALIFLGYGDGTFSRQDAFSTGSNTAPFSCAIADMNNDKYLDIIISDCDAGKVILLMGFGNGSFANEQSYSTIDNSCLKSVAISDFNNDSVLDIVVTNSNNDMIGIMLGSIYTNGVRENTYSTGTSPHPRAISLGDFNNDAQLDIVLANYGSDSLEILLGYKNGSFPMQMKISTGSLSVPTSTGVGNFNNDSILDIIVSNSYAENIGIFLGFGNGSFETPQTYSTGIGSIPQSVAVGDFNNDKQLDIAVASTGTDSTFVLLQYNSGTFRKQISYDTGIDSTPWSVSTGDFNNDGWADFIIVYSGSDSLGVYLGVGNGTFLSPTIYFTGSNWYPWSVSVADFNKDNHLDIVVSYYWYSSIGIFLGLGNGTFSNQTTYSTGTYSGPNLMATGDLNNDSRVDIVVANAFYNYICIFYGNGDGTFSNMITYSTGYNSRPLSVAIADFDNNSLLDIVVANYGSSNICIFIGYGNSTFSEPVFYSTGQRSLPEWVSIGDFNNDARLDIVVANFGTDNVGVFFGNNNGTFSQQMLFSTGTDSTPSSLAIGDFNNDNQLDIGLASFGNNNFGILLGCFNGTFFSQLTYSTGDESQPNSIATVDFNNDGLLDIVVPNSATDSVDIFLGYAKKTFLNAASYSTGLSSQPISIATADFNNDTLLDIVIANNGTDNVMILFGSGYGTFVDQRVFLTGNGSHPCSVTVGDLNNDYRPDIIVTNSGTNNVGVFLSNGTDTYSNQMTYFTDLSSQPQSVILVDFNNDTLLDIAVTNYGANSVGVFFGYSNGSFATQMIFLTGFGSRPFALVAGDVNKDNLTDIVVTNDGYGNIDILMKTC
ncbi:unnamed protein product [Adineta steineri]|uniref:Uncharacterized protein n=1 Tax=Adineta steineri TaxID=433720 RepID=A0A814KNQ7_9BILA|nr:unnamed protein product [Adineta steineri]